jgi:hypothetical protein
MEFTRILDLQIFDEDILMDIIIDIKKRSAAEEAVKERPFLLDVFEQIFNRFTKGLN